MTHVAVQYSAASFIETINSSSLTMDSDEFVARMIAAGVPDIEAASTQPLSPHLRMDPTSTPVLPTAGASLIPSAPEDTPGLPPAQASLTSKPDLPLVLLSPTGLTILREFVVLPYMLGALLEC